MCLRSERVEYQEHIAAVQQEVRAIADQLRTLDMDSRVPTCPDWTVADLMRHVGEFTGFWTHVLCEGTGRPKTDWLPMPRVQDGEAVADWYAGLGSSLITELQATPGDQSVWTWVEDRQNARFVARRCAHELAIHRFDLQMAAGRARPIDGPLAVDGVEEIFVMMAASVESEVRPEGAGRGNGETLHVHATDVPGEWLIRLDASGVEVERIHAKGDLALRGPASDLELLLYQRPTIGAVERIGDESALAAWYRAFHFG